MTDFTFAGAPHPHPGGFTFSQGLAEPLIPPANITFRTTRQFDNTTPRTDRLSLGRDGDGLPARSWSGAGCVPRGKSGDAVVVNSPRNSEQPINRGVRQT